MNIAQTVNESEATEATNTSFYVNMKFAELAAAINKAAAEAPNKDPKALTVQFNSKGQTITYIPENLEATYFHYSSDIEGTNVLTPPFEITRGNTVTCMLQADPTENSDASYKWKGIIQNRFDLQLVSGTKSKTQVTYKAVASDEEIAAQDEDDVIINIRFTLDNVKYYVSWDPAVLIRV
jgi:hypothetical protein